MQALFHEGESAHPWEVVNLSSVGRIRYGDVLDIELHGDATS